MEKVHRARGQVVHPADHLNRSLLLEIGQDGAAPSDVIEPEDDVRSGDRVDTIAVPAVLAAFNWQKGSDRYLRVQKFVQALFNNWEKFRQPPRHPKWRDVNLAATVPGWTRLSTAQEMLDRLAQADAQAHAQTATNAQVNSSDFASFLAANGGSTLTPQQREALFRQFVEWQRHRQAQPAR